jgi:hypothetical protein
MSQKIFQFWGGRDGNVSFLCWCVVEWPYLKTLGTVPGAGRGPSIVPYVALLSQKLGGSARETENMRAHPSLPLLHCMLLRETMAEAGRLLVLLGDIAASVRDIAPFLRLLVSSSSYTCCQSVQVYHQHLCPRMSLDPVDHILDPGDHLAWAFPGWRSQRAFILSLATFECWRAWWWMSRSGSTRLAT